MTATNRNDQRHNLVKFVQQWRFLKSTPLVFRVFFAVAVMVYLVAVMVVGVMVERQKRRSTYKKSCCINSPKSTFERPDLTWSHCR